MLAPRIGPPREAIKATIRVAAGLADSRSRIFSKAFDESMFPAFTRSRTTATCCNVRP